jgi:hypothetical protein
MKSRTLQELINQIFSNAKTKQQFLNNPESVISQFSLTEQEKRAVLDVHSRIGLVTTDSPQLEAVIDPNITWWAPSP